MVAAYKRLRRVEIAKHSAIVAAILSGELFWSKVEIPASVGDDKEYAKLLNEAADGFLSAAKMRKRVKVMRVGIPTVYAHTKGDIPLSPVPIGSGVLCALSYSVGWICSMNLWPRTPKAHPQSRIPIHRHYKL
jgi:hypothetical protein